MKIVLLCSNLHVGRIQRAVLMLADALAQKENLTVELALLHGKGEFLSMHSAAVNVVDLNCGSHPATLLSPFSSLLKYLKKAKPDVLLSFGNTTNALIAWAKLLYRLPFRLIVLEHSTFSALRAKKNKFRQWSGTMLTRFLYRQSARCVCLSQGIADDLVESGIIPRAKACVIYNPVDGPALIRQSRQDVTHPWLRPGEPPTILSAGRLVKSKGIDTLIHAFQELRQFLDVDARLLIIGEGPDRERLESLTRRLGIDDTVHFLGFTPTPYAYMSKVSLLVFSSQNGGFGNVLLEALTCGVNVVSTDCKGGPREILEDGKWGRLAPVGDVQALAVAMRDTLAHPLPAEDLKKRAGYFSTERSVEAYYNILCKNVRQGRHKHRSIEKREQNGSNPSQSRG